MHFLKLIPHRHVYIAALMLLAASLPLSYAFMSISQGLLLLNWLLEARFKARFALIRNSKSLLLVCAFYVVHIIGMFYTSDLEWGWHDLHIKLPLLILPLLVATSEPIGDRTLKLILQVFVGAVVLASFIVTSIIFRLYHKPWTDIRETSIFISHIRFGLLIAISIFVCFYYTLHCPKRNERLVYLSVSIWLFVFLLLLQALTGLVALFVTLIVLFVVLKNKEPYLRYNVPVAIFIFSFVGISLAYVGYVAIRFYDMKPLPSNLPSHTINGNEYINDTNCLLMENGNRVNVLICDKELRAEWNKRSALNYDSLDAKKQELKRTLIRYLASRGLSRDSVGVSSLSQSDIRNVELGMGNYIFSKKGLYSKLYSVFWEFYVFDIKGNPSGHSVTQRILFLKTAGEVFMQNFWFGVGTGDIRVAINKQYEKDNSLLTKDFRHRAHNQFLTFAVTFGLPLTLIILCVFFLIPYWENKYSSYFFLVVFCVSMLSFLNEDTLETHPGISFVAFFYALFLFGVKNGEQKEDK